MNKSNRKKKARKRDSVWLFQLRRQAEKDIIERFVRWSQFIYKYDDNN